MTDLAVVIPLLPLLGAAAALASPGRAALRIALAVAAATTALAAVVAAWALLDPSRDPGGGAIALDVAGAVMLAVTALVGAGSVAVAPAYLADGHGHGGLVRTRRAESGFVAALLVFWAVLLAIPLVANLGGAWLLVEASTAASALLVGWSGRRRALEAGWKYILLTTLGLGIALLGIVVLEAAIAASGRAAGFGALGFRALATGAPLGHDAALVAYVLLVGGLAAKIGWAPVHNWLPDAHSEAPAPASALLSAAALPSVLLVAWRTEQALVPSVGADAASDVFIAFGLASLAVAVPFLWRPLPWKRLLAYSSLEHMGIVALAIGFGTPLALAGAALHIAGHGIAKGVGFQAAVPLLAAQRSATGRPAGGVARTRPVLGATLAGSLVALAALPPSPLIVSEALIAWGGLEAGRTWVVVAMLALLALAFPGLAWAALEVVAGRPRARVAGTLPGARTVAALAAGGAVALVALAVLGLAADGSGIAAALVRGLG